MRWLNIGLLVAISLGGCTFSPISPSDVTDFMRQEWKIGQDRLAEVIGDVAYTVDITQFEFDPISGVFDCGGTPANGCFSSTRRRIRWNTETPTVIRHEAGHAILWRLDKDCWHDFEHIPSPWGCS